MPVEETWGELSSRFRFLRSEIAWTSDDWESEVSKVIYASMLLHNLCKRDKEQPFPREDQDFKLEQRGLYKIKDDDARYDPASLASTARDALAVWISERYTLNAGGQVVDKH